MATYDATLETLRGAFANLIASGEIDVVADDGGALDVMSDAWTLHAEGWPGPTLAWLAHDDEPSRYDDEAIRATLPDRVLVTLAEADRALSGDLSTALQASHDPFSAALASVLAGSATAS